jgi:PKD repeat protein
MRSIPLLAATSVILVLATGCGDDGTGVGTPPAADFTQTCTELSCTFTDASTPAGEITAWSWNFGDPNSGTANNASTLQNPVHLFSAAGTYNVQLTVTNARGATANTTESVVVTGPTTGGNPTASMSAPSCTGLTCTFTSTSTDVAPGTIASTDWNFGDPNSGANNTANGLTVEHTFSAAGTYVVTLTVTDNEALTGTTTQSVTVSGPTGQSCTAGPAANEVTCTITLAQRSSVSIRLESEDCEIGNNNLFIPPPEPRAQTVFFNMCNLIPPQERTLIDDGGAEMIFEAGTPLPIVFRRGSDPIAVAPQAQVATTAANTWTLSIDDGGNPGGPGEPDFQDVILTVTASPR